MASSNRHWPSLFKSKPSSAHHQWHHDINHSSLLSSHCHKPNFYASGTTEERTPEPKPRWNPKPEQIRILEAIFNSGMVNPPRDEIRRIRAQLQAYGQVGDANVFYWFQNRKSRSKHKQRHIKSATAARSTAPPPPPPPPPPAAPTSSTSSSSSGSNNNKILPPLATFFDLSESPASPILMPSELILPLSTSYGLSTGEVAGGVSAWSPVVWGDKIMEEIPGRNACPEEEVGGLNRTEVIAALSSVTDPALLLPPVTVANATATIDTPLPPLNDIQAARSMVFINEVAYEVMAGPLNVREAFGGDAILLHSSGHPVLTDEWGLTLHPLQHGASYYLVQ